MSIVSTAKEFLDYKWLDSIMIVKGDITIPDALELGCGDATIIGEDNASLTFQKEICAHGCAFLFKNLTINFNSSGELGAIHTLNGATVKFENCVITVAGKFVTVAEGNIYALSVLLDCCTITSTKPLFETVDGKSVYPIDNLIHVGNTVSKYARLTARQVFSLDRCTINYTGTDPLVNMTHRIEATGIYIEDSALNIPNAKNLVKITGPSHRVVLGEIKIPSQMTGCSPSEKTLTHVVLVDCDESSINNNNPKAKIVFRNCTFSEKTKYLVNATGIFAGKPGGYPVEVNELMAHGNLVSYQIDASKRQLQPCLDAAKDINGEIYIMPSAEPSNEDLVIHRTKHLVIGGPINAKSLHIHDAYVKIDGAVTLSETFSANAMSYVEGSGSITANGKKIALPIKNVYTDSRDPNGPVLDGKGSVGKEGDFTNAVVQALIDKFKNRIFLIRFDNGMTIAIGYQRSEAATIDDILLEHIGGVDMIGVRRRIANPNSTRHTRQTTGASFITWHLTRCVQAISIMDEGAENFRPDPMSII